MRWASQDQNETQKRAGGGQFEELDTEILTHHFYDQSGGNNWLYICKKKVNINKLERLEVYTNTGHRHNFV